MKSFLTASVASLVLSLGSLASAAPPYFHQNHVHSSNYGYPSTGYGTVQNYGGYQAYQSYPTSPQYGQSWNNSAYRAPSLTYDPVHGDYHNTTARRYQSLPQNYGNYGGYNTGYGASARSYSTHGHHHGASHGW